MTTSLLNSVVLCNQCKRQLICVAGQPLGDIEAAVDFDASLGIVAGPSRRGQLLALGGETELVIGAAPACAIHLPGPNVSPRHGRLIRMAHAPSRWKIEHMGGDVGIYVNGDRVASRELAQGDVIDIGPYELHYAVCATADEIAEERLTRQHPEDADDGEFDLAPVSRAPTKATSPLLSPLGANAGRSLMDIEHEQEPAPAPTSPGPICPSCRRRLKSRARVCIDCGIHVPSGRPLVTSEKLDENLVHGNTSAIVTLLSWIIWVTPLPLPLASAAYGKHKPQAIWGIAYLTIVTSLIFLIASLSNPETDLSRFMLWPWNQPAHVSESAADLIARQLKEHHPNDDNDTPLTEEELKQLQALVNIYRAERARPFSPGQLVTHAFLHSTSGVFSFLMHLSGNMLFLLVFGTRVNAIIGNIATAIIYQILAACSGLVFLLTLPPNSVTPLVGASGAIMGLAGMYLVLLPAHPVYCAMWVRFRLSLFLKIFALRGAWIVLIYFAYDVLMVWLSASGNVAHWAHIGGFATGALLGFIMLCSRQFTLPSGDLVSIVLGKYAWPMIGRPR